MPLSIPVGPSTVTINRDDRVVVSALDATIDGTRDEGFFARDTRFVSGYGLWVNGARPVLLNSSPVEFFSARYEYTNPALIDIDGAILPSSLSIRLDRTVAGGVHEDLDVINYGRRPVRLTIEIEIDSDFADIFDVKQGGLVRRGTLNSRWFRSRRELRTTYSNRDFRRELVIAVDRPDTTPQFANGRLVFVATIAPKEVWHTCLKWLPVTSSGRRPQVLSCNALERRESGGPHLPKMRIESPNTIVRTAWDQAREDIEALRLEDPMFERGVFIPAAGVPWFMTLFGRDSLIVSMQGISGFPELAAGALRRLGALQATEDDPERDMEPGKIAHEIRHGELAQLGILPYTPYYGSHDATSLYVIVLSYLYQWRGDRAILERFLPNAEAAVAWIDKYGDGDGDGFQEYATRSSHGYYNQGWKDAGDAIPERDGTLAPLPLALCELQGYVYDAKLRMASIYELLGDKRRARQLRGQAERLFDRFNEAFWWEAEGTYYLGLNGNKDPIETVASNAGHLLSSGIVPPERAGSVVRRLMAPDMWSGWGVRTLSTDHPAYNPFSYHTGSVWPHDNAILAGGFRRYGFDTEAATLAKGIFDAASRFVATRLPELFAGLPRQNGSFPVQYLGANVPQAWAAGTILRLVAVLCGIHASSDADGSRLYVHPSLPDWLPELTIHDLRAGSGALTLRFSDSKVDVLKNTSGFEVIEASPHADQLAPDADGPAPRGRRGGGAAGDAAAG